MLLDDLICINENVNLGKYLKFKDIVEKNMPHPDWLGDFTKKDLKKLLKNNAKIWIYYLNKEPVCSMMLKPSNQKELDRYYLKSKETICYGSMFVNPKYVGNSLQYQMLKKLDEYSKKQGYKFAIGTIHPENKYSINNILKDNFLYIETLELPRGIRNVYLKLL